MRVKTDQAAFLDLVHGKRGNLAAEQAAGVVSKLGIVTLVDARDPLALPLAPLHVKIELGDAAEVELLALLERERVGIDLVERVATGLEVLETAKRFIRPPIDRLDMIISVSMIVTA